MLNSWMPLVMPSVMGQAVVFGRPNEAFAELMHLEEATLQEILRSRVSV